VKAKPLPSQSQPTMEFGPSHVCL